MGPQEEKEVLVDLKDLDAELELFLREFDPMKLWLGDFLKLFNFIFTLLSLFMK